MVAAASGVHHVFSLKCIMPHRLHCPLPCSNVDRILADWDALLPATLAAWGEGDERLAAAFETHRAALMSGSAQQWQELNPLVGGWAGGREGGRACDAWPVVLLLWAQRSAVGSLAPSLIATLRVLLAASCLHRAAMPLPSALQLLGTAVLRCSMRVLERRCGSAPTHSTSPGGDLCATLVRLGCILRACAATAYTALVPCCLLCLPHGRARLHSRTRPALVIARWTAVHTPAPVVCSSKAAHRLVSLLRSQLGLDLDEQSPRLFASLIPPNERKIAALR